MVRRIYPEVPAVFVDTGLEYPELREFVKTIDNVTWLKPNINFKQVIEKYGYPVISKEVSRDISVARNKPDGKTASKFIRGSEYHLKYGDRWLLEKYIYLLDAPFKITNKCCDIMKKKPFKEYEAITGRKPITGLLAEESARRTFNWFSTGCNAFDLNKPMSMPLSFWTDQDILEYIDMVDLNYASVYGDIIKNDIGKYCTTRCERTGCVFCAYGSHKDKEPNRFQRLKKTHPKLWNYCMKPTSEGGLGMKEVLEYIGVKTGHEDEIDISNSETDLTDE